MSKSLTDIQNEIEEREFLAKLAHVESVWGENLEARELLADTIDALEKEAAAGAFGEQGISPSQLISSVLHTPTSSLVSLRASWRRKLPRPRRPSPLRRLLRRPPKRLLRK